MVYITTIDGSRVGTVLIFKEICIAAGGSRNLNVTQASAIDSLFLRLGLMIKERQLQSSYCLIVRIVSVRASWVGRRK